LENNEVLQKSQLLLFVDRELHPAGFSQTKHTTFDFLVVVFGNCPTFFLPFFKRIFPLKTQDLNSRATMKRKFEHLIYFNFESTER